MCTHSTCHRNHHLRHFYFQHFIQHKHWNVFDAQTLHTGSDFVIPFHSNQKLHTIIANIPCEPKTFVGHVFLALCILERFLGLKKKNQTHGFLHVCNYLFRMTRDIQRTSRTKSYHGSNRIARCEHFTFIRPTQSPNKALHNTERLPQTLKTTSV